MKVSPSANLLHSVQPDSRANLAEKNVNPVALQRRFLSKKSSKKDQLSHYVGTGMSHKLLTPINAKPARIKSTSSNDPYCLTLTPPSRNSEPFSASIRKAPGNRANVQPAITPLTNIGDEDFADRLALAERFWQRRIDVFTASVFEELLGQYALNEDQSNKVSQAMLKCINLNDTQSVNDFVKRIKEKREYTDETRARIFLTVSKFPGIDHNTRHKLCREVFALTINK